MARNVRLSLVVTVAVCSLAAGLARAGGTTRVFYLSVHPGQCLIGSTKANAKTVLVVPCANRAHNLEIYALGHGGWAHRAPPPTAYSIAKTYCLSAFRRLTKHPIPATAGWQAFWADPGAETARYGDKILCSYRRWPRFGPLGSGWHIH